MKSLKKFLRNEKGVSAIIVAIAIVVIFGFAVIAIDLSLVQLTKTQLQNAADAAALAGAIILYTTDGNQAAATDEAIRVAGLNKAFQDRAQRPVNIGPGDVTFPGGDSVRVVTHRTEATGDPMQLFFLGILNSASGNKAGMMAKATAIVFPLSGTSCLRPWCIPDSWADTDGDHKWDPEEEYVDSNGNGVWDPGETFTDANGNGVWDSAEFYDPYITGYTPDSIGAQVTIQPTKADKWESEWYFEVAFPPINKGDPLPQFYEEWIVDCHDPSITVSIGDQLYRYPGHRVGPTSHGIEDLINQDPGAQWDPGTNTVINSAFPVSPRVIKMAAFDPTLGLQPGPPQHLVVSKLLVLFVEDHDAAHITGRFMKLITEGEPCPDCPGGFLSTVNLVE